MARLEGHLGIAAVLEGMRNRHTNDLHLAFGSTGPCKAEASTALVAEGPREAEALLLLRCRPELAAQRDASGNLPLHLAALRGASSAAVAECLRAFPDGPRTRNDAGFLPHHLALERGHASLAAELAAAAGCRVRPVHSVLARAANEQHTRADAGTPTPTGGSSAAGGAAGSGGGSGSGSGLGGTACDGASCCIDATDAAARLGKLNIAAAAEGV